MIDSWEWAFGQESALPPSLPAFKIKETFFPTNLVFLLAFEIFANPFGCPREAVAISGSGVGQSRRHQDSQERLWGAAARGYLSLGEGFEGIFLTAAETICSGDPPCFLPLLGTDCQPMLFFGGTERRLKTSWPTPRPSKSDWRWCTRLTSLSSTKCYLSIFASGFWCVSAVEAHLCWKMLVWDSASSGGLWQFCLLVSVCFICMIGILVAFSKVGNSGSIH